jgi:hypothetical protein
MSVQSVNTSSFQFPCSTLEKPTLRTIYAALDKLGLSSLTLDGETPEKKRASEVLYMLLNGDKALQTLAKQAKPGTTEYKVLTDLLNIASMVQHLDGDIRAKVDSYYQYYHSTLGSDAPVKTFNDYVEVWKDAVKEMVYRVDTAHLTGWSDIKYRINHFFD